MMVSSAENHYVYKESQLSSQQPFLCLERKLAARVREDGVNLVNCPQRHSDLPPHYPRQSSATNSSAMDSSYYEWFSNNGSS
ncbi:hypothetical protein POTOM_024869 [Populus tomentosa]|uniref:Uncharacterized protein n=1 Tax=Populus tomentosa TaxID=118781 RepID=A0A8X8CN61_POPTO|nr:hypothetical protein POTOM_024869 [Populus tomentosa]